MSQLEELRCACGSDQVMAVAPGEDAIHDLFLLSRGRPDKAWCMECWERQFGEKAA